MPDAAVVAPLTLNDRVLLLALEARVTAGLRQCADAVDALLEIHRRELYRGTHATFQDYCRAKWPQYTDNYVYRLLKMGEVRETIAELPYGNQIVEGQARQLAGLSPEQQREVWSAATEGGQKKPRTADVVAARDALVDGRRAAVGKLVRLTTSIERAMGQLDSGEQDAVAVALAKLKEVILALP